MNIRPASQTNGWHAFVAAFALIFVCLPFLEMAVSYAGMSQNSRWEQVLAWVPAMLLLCAGSYLVREFLTQVGYLRREHLEKPFAQRHSQTALPMFETGAKRADDESSFSSTNRPAKIRFLKPMKKSLFLVMTIGLIILGAFALIQIPPTENVAIFNRFCKTELSDRRIYFSSSGFVDTTFHAAVPMSHDEFIDTAKLIGMTKNSLAARQHCGDRPWWCQEPKSDVFIRDRIGDRSHRDYIEGHYDSAKQTGYFMYFDH
jgi:hypothetical protein